MRQAGRKIFMLIIFIDTRKEDVLIKPSHKVIITNCGECYRGNLQSSMRRNSMGTTGLLYWVRS